MEGTKRRVVNESPGLVQPSRFQETFVQDPIVANCGGQIGYIYVSLDQGSFVASQSFTIAMSELVQIVSTMVVVAVVLVGTIVSNLYCFSPIEVSRL